MKTFTITDSHLKLARHMYVGWCEDEYGAPEIDPKRPYGNSSVTEDILEIIGIPFKQYEGAIPESLTTFARELHESMEIAIQIFLCTGTFQVGEYESRDEYSSLSWQKKPYA
jgi:hypothetical protein